MREILFRGKTKNNQWVFGDLQTVRGSASICVGGDENGIINSYYVLSDTISQFVGLFDKNGKRVFEGDIIKVDMIGGAEKACEIGIGECYDTNGEIIFGVWAKCDDNKLIIPNAALYEVIGNKWDNPELLGR